MPIRFISIMPIDTICCKCCRCRAADFVVVLFISAILGTYTFVISSLHSTLLFPLSKGETKRVEAAADSWGLYVGVVYNASSDGKLSYQRYFCSNGNTLRVTSLDKYGRISATGCDAQGIGTISTNADTGAFFSNTLKWATDLAPVLVEAGVAGATGGAAMTTAPSTLGDWTVCSNSNQCINQCCSGKYSGGILKCTPVGGFKTWEGCVGSTTVATKQGDWTVCTNSNQCTNQCCSSKYSDGVLKCTPVGGFKSWEGCVGSATRNLRGGDDAEDGFHSAAGDEGTFQQQGAVEELVWDSLEYEAAAEDTHGAVLN
jgi:hypothetical protein